MWQRVKPVLRFDIKARELAAQAEQRELEAASMRDLEFNKSELVVWVELRKDILAEMWAAHREITKSMSTVIWQAQEMLAAAGYDPYQDPPISEPFWPVRSKLQPWTEKYRRAIYDHIDLVSPEAINAICQKFLETSYKLFDVDGRSDHDLSTEYEFVIRVTGRLKGVRNEFTAYTAQLYGLEKMMPWMVKGVVRDKSTPETPAK